MSEWIMLGIGLILTVGTGFFVASEFALVNLDRADLEARRDRGETRLQMTIAALTITSTHLSSAQLGITLTTLLTGYTMEPAISSLLAPPLEAWGIPDAVAVVASTIVAVTLATLLSMILGELVPKNLALALPLKTAKFVIPFQTAFTWVFKPAIIVLNGSANGILRMVGIEPKEELSGARTAEELSSPGAPLGQRRRARARHGDPAQPHPAVRRPHGIRRDDPAPATGRASSAPTPPQAVLELASQTGHSRFPVIDEDVDDVVGFVHVKQAMAVPRDRRADVPVSALQSEALRVPETMTPRRAARRAARPRLPDGRRRRRVRRNRRRRDARGPGRGTHRRGRRRARQVARRHRAPRPTPSASRACCAPTSCARRTDLVVPEDGTYETVAGYVMSELGRLPVVGDTVLIESGELTVERLDGRRIDRLRFTPDESEVAPVADVDGVKPAKPAKPAVVDVPVRAADRKGARS